MSWPDAAFAPHDPPHPIYFSGPATTTHTAADFAAWPTYRPTSQDHSHSAYCHQNGNEAATLAACACPQHQHSRPSAAAPQPVPTPPPSDGSPHHGWAPEAPLQSEYEAPSSKRISRLGWTDFDNNPPVSRSDGLRKKNAKFEIPEDRNLENLDALIKVAQSESEIKELKMQKRLLRNREAALHSRQKKKTHTEWLEHERESLSTRLYNQQHELTALRIKLDDQERDKTSWQEQLSRAEQKVAAVQHEKTILLEQHARETRQLRVEVSRLQSLVHSSDHSAMGSPTSTNPASATTYTSDESVNFSQGSNFGGNDWDGGGYEFMDSCLDPEKLRQATSEAGPDILSVH